jgi:hypothetical protein
MIAGTLTSELLELGGLTFPDEKTSGVRNHRIAVLYLCFAPNSLRPGQSGTSHFDLVNIGNRLDHVEQVGGTLEAIVRRPGQHF